MKRLAPAFAVAFVFAAVAAAQSVPELFHKAKEQVKAGSWEDALKTLEALDVEAARPGNEAAQRQLVGPTAFYRAVGEANLGQAEKARAHFVTFLNEQPNASIDKGMYSKKVVAAFEEARRSLAVPVPAVDSSSMFTAFQEFKAPANISEPADEKWGDGPVKWIMTTEEKRAWSSLSSGGERVQFIEKFWEARNPKPGSDDNSFRTGFDRRVAFADSRFVQDEKQRGSLTDRGMVFVLLGPPTWAGRKPLSTGDDASDAAGLSTVGSQDAANAQRALTAGASKPSTGRRAVISDQFSGPGTTARESSNNYREVWHYRKELLPKGVSYLQVDFEFLTKKGYGSNVLQRDQQPLATLDAAKNTARSVP